ncbi:MAG: tetratricopeptide repeat protein [Tannerella sp.]|jgi:signal transduction histidine kinase|nr:tetratricopeptide repeat protein [Tannerella sp.]
MRIYRLYCVLGLAFFICNGRTAAQMFPSELDSLKNRLDTQLLMQKEKIDVLWNIGLYYNLISQYDSARVYLEKALEIPGGREYEGGRIVSNLANTYGFQGHYAKALKYYLQAMKIGEKTMSGHFNIIRAMANAAEIYYLTGNKSQAFEYAERANQEIAKLDKIYSPSRRGYSYLIPQIQYIAGSVYLDGNELDKAEENMIKTYEIADSLAEKNLNDSGLPGGLFMYCSYGKEGLARISLAKKEYVQALKYAGEALTFAEKHGDPMTLAKIWYLFSDIYMERKQYDESEKCARKAMETYSQSVRLYPGLAFNRAVAYLFAGDRQKAYDFFYIYSNQMKENTDKNFRETVASMEIQFAIEKKEMRISDLERQKILYILTGIAGLVLAIAIWIILLQKIKNEQKEKRLIAASAVLEWEKNERKRFASDLHDGVNGMLSAMKLELNTVESLKNVCNQIDDCIETIRRMARGMMPSSLERYGMKAALEDYCRLFPNVNFHFFGENRRINERLELVVYYCACELVNNASRHSGAKNINVQLLQDDNRLALTVQDDGCGFDKPDFEECSGLKNIYDRITAFNGKMDINSVLGKGTEIDIELKTKNI